MMTVGGVPPARKPRRVKIDLPITLGQFVKLADLAGTGGEAKQLVLAGLVKVNGSVELRRGRKLVSGDVVEVRGAAAEVDASHLSPRG